MSVELFHGDCLDILASLPVGQVHMVFADLPYGTTRCRWDTVIPFESMWSAVKRVCRSNAAMLFTASQPFTSALVCSNMKDFRHEWVWIKNRGSNFANTVREPFKEHESVLMFCQYSPWVYNKQMQPRTGGGIDLVGRKVGTGKKPREGIGHFKEFTATENLPEMRVPSSWQKFNTQVGLHPTQKPVDLVRYFIRTYSNPGDTVLDFCMGSGTTGIAAIMEGRNFIGIEKEKKYFNVAADRIKKATE